MNEHLNWKNEQVKNMEKHLEQGAISPDVLNQWKADFGTLYPEFQEESRQMLHHTEKEINGIDPEIVDGMKKDFNVEEDMNSVDKQVQEVATFGKEVLEQQNGSYENIREESELKLRELQEKWKRDDEIMRQKIQEKFSSRPPDIVEPIISKNTSFEAVAAWKPETVFNLVKNAKDDPELLESLVTIESDHCPESLNFKQRALLLAEIGLIQAELGNPEYGNTFDKASRRAEGWLREMAIPEPEILGDELIEKRKLAERMFEKNIKK